MTVALWIVGTIALLCLGIAGLIRLYLERRLTNDGYLGLAILMIGLAGVGAVFVVAWVILLAVRHG